MVWFQSDIISSVNSTSPQWPHILAGHSSLSSLHSVSYFIQIFPPMHPSPSSALHPALSSDCLLHWEASSISPRCCACLVYLCVCKALWVCWPSAVASLTAQMDLHFLSHIHSWSDCPGRTALSSPHVHIHLHSPHPHKSHPIRPRPSLLCTTTLQLPPCSDGCLLEPHPSLLIPFSSFCIAPSSSTLLLLSSPLTLSLFLPVPL